jgi:iron(III) transport system substrate-binding protein
MPTDRSGSLPARAAFGAGFHWRIALVCAVAAVVGGCSDDRVVLYVSADDYVVREVIERFTETTGIEVNVVGDTEAAKTTGLANRLRAERDRPRADVFWSSECFMMIQLAQEGLLDPHDSPAVAHWPADFHDADRLWHGFGLRARVIVYAPDRVEPVHVPDQWSDLKHERWKGRIVMADPRFGTTRGHMGVMKWFWERELPGAFNAFLEFLADNDVRLLTSGNAGVVQAVASGEADIGLTDTDDVWAAQRNGAKVDLVYPYHGIPGKRGDGTLVIPNTVALVKGGSHRADAIRLVDFLLSEEVERLLVESDSHNVPVRESLAAAHPQYAVPHPLRVDWAQATAEMDGAVDEAMRLLGGGG